MKTSLGEAVKLIIPGAPNIQATCATCKASLYSIPVADEYTALNVVHAIAGHRCPGPRWAQAVTRFLQRYTRA